MPFSNTPYPVSFDGTNISLQNVLMISLTPDSCSGTIVGSWGGNSATPRNLSINASLSATVWPCTIVGTLNQVSGLPLNITP